MMRLSAAIVAVTVISLGSVGKASAQRPFSPDSARPPLVLKATPEERLRIAVLLMTQGIERAIQRGDTTLLRALIPDASIPDAEKPVALRAGCRSLGHALARLRAKPTTARTSPALPLGFLHYENEILRARADGDTIASFSARLMDRSERGRVRFVPLQFTLTRSGNAFKLVRAPGLLAGLCGMAVSR